MEEHASARLQETMDELRAQGYRTMEVDLTAVTYLSRDAVWVLLDHVREAGALDALRLLGASGQPEYALRQTGMSRTLH
ncbi:hypothetical protein GXW83_02495 [Streptacidiphilus sp. PB12-B1b]|uniref:STAS domain-containing protein n=1 Tax=Streptacidiphilus sp. PB12-B1b TaxID=2705012 RepID=UPI0015FDFC73|nr:hypothetical protein [Streptacidiphilus sp. PB12-B1b]QMU74810.1 hypothetical protein GXW83_02495 [Streptacidiphilus sp. PB12-B1b]